MTDQTIDRNELPVAPGKFTGRIGATYADSEPEVPTMFAAPEGAPNVLVILLDNTGLGQTSTFGGPPYRLRDCGG